MSVIKQLTYKVHIPDKKGDTSQERSVSLVVDSLTPKYLLHRAIVIQNENARQGSASSKTRSDVICSTKKPWKQKGTGRARSGSSNSPLWKGGGVAFGPKPRVYRKKLNIKEKRLALRTALYNFSSRLTVIEGFPVEKITPNTKEVINSLNNGLGLDLRRKTLLIFSNPSPYFAASLRNVAGVTVTSASNLNLRTLLLAERVVLEEKTLLTLSKL